MGIFEIRLENARFFSHHGVFDHETRDGNEFEVNLLVKYRAGKYWRLGMRERPDSLEDTISYVDLFEIVKNEMNRPRKLLETVAVAIVQKIKLDYPFCMEIECKITKLCPPIAGLIGNTSVTYKVVN